jgi:hypothetical protein
MKQLPQLEAPTPRPRGRREDRRYAIRVFSRKILKAR